MGFDSRMKSGADYLPHYNWTPGMNDEVAYADRAGYCTSVEMLTSGHPADWTDFGALEVGNAYDMDPMDEEREMMTFSQGGSSAKGMIGMAGTTSAPMQPTTKTVGDGKSVDLVAPQSYNDIALGKHK